MARRRYTPKLKAQLVLEVLAGDRTPGQVAKAYGVHPNSVGLWKRRFVDRAPEIFVEETTVNEYERRIRDLEQLLGRKEVEIALLKKLPGPERLSVEKKVALVRRARGTHGLAAALRGGRAGPVDVVPPDPQPGELRREVRAPKRDGGRTGLTEVDREAPPF